jgi:hypothetical protein
MAEWGGMSIFKLVLTILGVLFATGIAGAFVGVGAGGGFGGPLATAPGPLIGVMGLPVLAAAAAAVGAVHYFRLKG